MGVGPRRAGGALDDAARGWFAHADRAARACCARRPSARAEAPDPLTAPTPQGSQAAPEPTVLAGATRSNGREVIARTLSVEAVAKRVLAVYEQARARRGAQ